MEWLLESQIEGRRSEQKQMLVRGVIFSAILHLFLLATMTASFSGRHSLPMSTVVTVDLLASLPSGPAPASRPKAAAVAPAPPKKALPKKRVLPKRASPAPAKPKKVAPPPPRPRPEELEYDDAMAKLREEMGEDLTQPAEESPVETTEQTVAAASPGGGRPGVPTVSKEVAEWALAARRHVRSVFVTPPDYLNRGLVTELDVRLSARGDVLGTPKVARSSGDPFWDDNAVRAVLRATPLPAPPESGTWPFAFRSEER